MREAGAGISNQEQLVCRVTKRSGRREPTGTKVFQELERLGVSPAILESLKSAQKSGPEIQNEYTDDEGKI